jgi:hypothetical protein
VNPYQGFRAARLQLLVLLGGELLWLGCGQAVLAVVPPGRVRRSHCGGRRLSELRHLPRRMGTPVHYRDAFHYFMGAKYLPELGYTRLYDATLVAGRELGAVPAAPAFDNARLRHVARVHGRGGLRRRGSCRLRSGRWQPSASSRTMVRRRCNSRFSLWGRTLSLYSSKCRRIRHRL